jgi:hypothetical protein
MRTRCSVTAVLLVAFILGWGSSGAGPAGSISVRASSTPAAAPQAGAPIALTLPNAKDSLKFAVFGDFGTGSREQYQLAGQMKRVHDIFPFELVTLAGDNLYGAERPQDFQDKFEVPYKPLLD